MKSVFIHNYNKLEQAEFWDHKYNVINRIPKEEINNLRQEIYEAFSEQDINFLLICNKSYEYNPWFRA